MPQGMGKRMRDQCPHSWSSPSLNGKKTGVVIDTAAEDDLTAAAGAQQAAGGALEAAAGAPIAERGLRLRYNVRPR